MMHPTRVPANVERLKHDIGEFPIQFCGTKEYYWMNAGRCFLYESEDSERVPGHSSNSKSLNQSFLAGLKEAAKLYKKYTEEKTKREQSNVSRIKQQKHLKPPLYSRIQTNRPFGDCPVYTAERLDHQMCDCDPEVGRSLWRKL